jgi:hypothetical protein
MTAADWLAVYAGAPTFIAAVTALVVALRTRQTANATQKAVISHITKSNAHQAPRP